MKRPFATVLLVALMVATATAASFRLSTRKLPKLEVPIVFGKNPGQPSQPLLNREPQQPYQKQPKQQEQSKQQEPPKQQEQPYQQQQKPYQQQQQLHQEQEQQQQQPHTQLKQQQSTTERPELETTTQDRSIITAPLKTCPEGQRMNPDRKCESSFGDPEGEKK